MLARSSLLVPRLVVPDDGLFGLLSLQNGRLAIFPDEPDRLATFDGLDCLFTRNDHGRRQVGERRQEGSRRGPGVLSEDGTASEDGATEHASVIELRV